MIFTLIKKKYILYGYRTLIVFIKLSSSEPNMCMKKLSCIKFYSQKSNWLWGQILVLDYLLFVQYIAMLSIGESTRYEDFRRKGEK